MSQPVRVTKGQIESQGPIYSQVQSFRVSESQLESQRLSHKSERVRLIGSQGLSVRVKLSRQLESARVS